MHAQILTNRNVSKTLGYHEQKVIHGKADYLLAENFLKDRDQLSRKDKLFHIQRLTSLSQRARQVTLHILINFHPDDKLSNEKMAILAREYMQKIGMEQRPYLVYRHYDAAHPHMHMVGSAIREDGKAIDLYELINGRSARITKEMEIEHSLVKWEFQQQHIEKYASLKDAQKIRYGHDPMAESITRVLNDVIDKYKYTTLAELNVILRLYNVKALRGQPTSRLYQKKGLLYCTLNEKGKTIGQPIKASAFYNKPTLAYLENKFTVNQSLRQPDRSRITNAIDWSLGKYSLDLPALRTALQKEHITTILQKDRSGQPVNIWYLDQQTHSIFEGAALGDRYRVQSLQQRCITSQAYKEQEQHRQQRQKDRGHNLDQSWSL